MMNSEGKTELSNAYANHVIAMLLVLYTIFIICTK